MEITPLDKWIYSKTGAKTAPELTEYQMVRLRETLTLAISRSRFYRKRLAGLDPAKIRTPDDLARLPFTTADELAENPGDFVCAAPHEIERIVTLPTSGTTGRPKRIFNTRGDIESTVDFFQHGMSTLAMRGDRVLIFLPGGAVDGVAALLGEGLKRLGCEGIIYGPVIDYEDARAALSRERCDCAVGLPSVMLALARTPGEPVSLRSVLLCSDYASDSLIRAIRCEWNCAVFTHYGLTESGLGGGVECAALDGIHMRDGDLLFEIVDPVIGSQVRDNGYGELVFTTLTRLGTPLIRYRTGDRSRILPEPCPCGTMLRRFERVSGRLSGYVNVGGVAISITMLDDIIYALPDVIGYTAEAACRDGRDCLIITVTGQCATENIKAAIMSDKRISGAEDGGLLSLDLQRGGYDNLPSGINKRIIIDRREK